MYPIDQRCIRERASTLSRAARILREEGGGAIADVDLLGLILGPVPGRESRESAGRVLELAGLEVLTGANAGAPWWKLLRPHQATRLAAAVELARRFGNAGAAHPPLVRTPQDVFEVTADLRGERREHFVGLYLNTHSRLLARETISVGSLNASIVHPREVFEPALRLAAATLVVVHNHPSGETDPSEDDLLITRRLVEAGEVLGVALLDHVIVGRRGFTSLREQGAV